MTPENESSMVTIVLKLAPHAGNMSVGDLISLAKSISDENGQIVDISSTKDLVLKAGLDKSLIKNTSLLDMVTKPVKSVFVKRKPLKTIKTRKLASKGKQVTQLEKLAPTWIYDNE